MLPLHHRPESVCGHRQSRRKAGGHTFSLPISNRERRTYSARICFRAAVGSVSQAVRNTSRGAVFRIFIRYGTVRSASALAVSRNSQPRPFCTMSSSSDKSELDKRTISRRNILCRVPTIKATQAARRCQRCDDFAQRNTSFPRTGLAAIIGAIK
jgi:hypothetical protein